MTSAIDRFLYRFLWAVSLLLVILTTAGFFVPGSLNWSFHYLGFLPWWSLPLYLVCAALILFSVHTGHSEGFLLRLAGFSDRKHTLFLAATLLAFAGMALLFRIPASLLGDSFSLVKNFADYQSGAAPLGPWHEPLSIIVLYHAITALGPLTYPDVLWSFTIVHLLFGALFIIIVDAIVRQVFEDPVERVSVFLFLLMLPYLEFFFGYTEVYSVSTVVLVAFVLGSILVLKEKLPFTLLAPLYVAVTFSHYINGILGVAVLYVAYLEYRRGRWKQVAAGCAIGVAMVLGVLAAVQFELGRVMNIDEISHFLSLDGNISAVNAYSQAYPVFSLYHLIDLMNYIGMMAPFGAAMILYWLIATRRSFDVSTPLNRWLIAACAFPFLFLPIAKLEQGNADDWDTFAAQFFLLNLLACVVFYQQRYPNRVKIFALILGMTLLHSGVWFTLNASREPAIERFRALRDKRTVSHLGQYTMALRLSRYYESEHDSLGQIDVWKQFIVQYPTDPRGYRNAINAVTRLKPMAIDYRLSFHEQWLAVDPENDTLRDSYVSGCLKAGDAFFAEGSLGKAEEMYTDAHTADSTLSVTHNNLGCVNATEGELTEAIALFREAIAIDTAYADAHYNLGTALIESGNTREGVDELRQAEELGNREAVRTLRQLKMQ